MEPNTNGISAQEKPKKIGAVISVLVIILVVIIAVLYFLGQKVSDVAPADTTPVAEDVLNDENGAAAIEADLNAQLQDVDYSF